MRGFADQGGAVLLVEQQIRNALAVADRAYVLNRGRVVMEGTASELRGRVSEIEAHYL
jgi:branched-chain amino acid transport system ATP-binding protein